MKLVKSLLLGSAAGIVAVAGASAADLPSRKSAPVEYVRVCSEHGKGFFYVPGSDTCIQIGGRVRADTVYQQSYNRNADSVGFGAQARINLDVRTNTPYGMVRSYLRYALSRGDAAWNTSGDYTSGTGIKTGAALDLAYIQFAGLTAGRVQSFFDFYADNYNFAAIRTSDVKTQALAYTANFGSGWSATIAIEDGAERRMYNGFEGTSLGGRFEYDIPGYRSAGQTMPDVVGNIMVNQSWGAAQLSGALHQVRPAFGSYGVVTDTANDVVYSAGYNDRKTTYGYAVKGAVKVNLPFIAPGDEFWAEVAYAEGALSYIGASNYGFHQNTNVPMTDAVLDANGKIKKTRGWSAMIDFLHYWTPSIRQNVFASYMKIDTNRAGYDTYDNVNYGRYNVGFVPTQEWRVGTNLIWSPIKNFDIGVEVLYTRTDPKGRVLSYNNGYAKTISSEDQWQGRLRIQRDF
ncbi:porin [Microvirga sp. W0021]|uniref:Porin n=1 Tax=Hohaiivirga grylli TaxID=3133970 RepID=A0ABV0BL22_9HYPH